MPPPSAQISQVQKSLQAMDLTEADKAQLAKIAAARSAMLDLRKKATQMKSEGRNDEAIALVKQSYNPAVAAYLQSLRDFVDLQQKYAAQRQSELGADRMRTVQLAGVMVALVLAGIGLGAYFLIRSSRWRRRKHWPSALLRATSARRRPWRGAMSLATCCARCTP